MMKGAGAMSPPKSDSPKEHPERARAEGRAKSSGSSLERGFNGKDNNNGKSASRRGKKTACQKVKQVHVAANVDDYIEAPNASSTQGIEKYYTTKEPPEVGWKRVALGWALTMLTVLIFAPMFMPSLAWYCLTVQGSLLVFMAGIIGIKYLHRTGGLRRRDTDS